MSNNNISKKKNNNKSPVLQASQPKTYHIRHVNVRGPVPCCNAAKNSTSLSHSTVIRSHDFSLSNN